MKNFSWKQFWYVTLLFFTITLIVALIWNYFDKEETIASLFTTRQLIQRGVMSVIMGFILKKN
jgi:hypothetical protein